MTDVSGTVDVILEFVDLAIERRRRALPAQAKSRIDALEETLRELIDGARPAPRKIEGRQTADISRPSPPTTGSGGAAAVKAEKKDAKQGSQSISDLVDRLELTPKDKQNLKNEVRLEDLPRSSYTPPSAPTYLGDYYSDDIVLSGDLGPAETPRAVVRADGELAQLSREVRVLFGLEREEPKPQVQQAPERIVAPGARRQGGPVTGGTAARPGAPRAPAAAASAAPARGRPTIVHLMNGGTKRGQIEIFDPSSGVLEFVNEDGAADAQMPLEEVMAIFFGLQRGEEGAAPAGQRVVVRLVNDRQIAGLTDDYREGGDSLTITPEQKRGNVDRIWIPAWAVKEIQLG